MATQSLDIPTERIAEFCRKWRITELSLFGSAARGALGPESDVDVLVRFDPTAPWTMLDVMRAKGELELMLGRPVDLIERPALERHHNPWLRHEILGTARVVYAA